MTDQQVKSDRSNIRVEPVLLSDMRDIRTEKELVPVFDPKRGHRLREREYTFWRDPDGRLMGSWRWTED